jgi:hypothetical protein
MKNYAFVLAGISVLALTGCVTQQQADEKLKKGCEAAVAAMIEPTTIKEIKSSTAADEKTMGSTFRRVVIKYTENDDFAESEREGSCLFSQQWGFFKSSHAALLEQVVYNEGEIIGKKDGNIQGDMNAFMKLNEKVDAAMGSN